MAICSFKGRSNGNRLRSWLSTCYPERLQIIVVVDFTESLIDILRCFAMDAKFLGGSRTHLKKREGQGSGPPIVEKEVDMAVLSYFY